MGCKLQWWEVVNCKALVAPSCVAGYLLRCILHFIYLFMYSIYWIYDFDVSYYIEWWTVNEY